MSAYVHYDSNVFFITQIIRDVRRGCSLSIDPEYFLDKIVEDLMFCDEILKKLMSRLAQNELLIKQERYLRDLYLAKRDLVLLLDELLGNILAFGAHVKPYASRFTQIIRSQKEDMMEIDDRLNDSVQKEDEKHIVSSEEYQFLFTDPDQE